MARGLLGLMVVAAALCAQRRMPADREAFAAAERLKEPVARIAAYEKFLRDFPEAPQAYVARRSIFEETVTLHRAERGRVMSTAKSLLKAVAPNDYGRLATAMAAHLHGEQLWPKDALEFAQKAVAAPGTAKRRAAAADTLGQIYRRAGDAKNAERWLRRALVEDPALAASAVALGEMASTPAEAIAYFAQARLAGPDREAMARLEPEWRKTHESLSGLEAYLDQRHRELFPSPITATAERYQRTPGRSGRTVLAEIHTGASCAPCAAADLATDAVLERYSRQEVAVVMYHQHIPGPDPLANDAAAALFKDRGARGVPYVRLDGRAVDGSGLREQAVEVERAWRPLLDRRLEAAPGAQLNVTALRDGGRIRVTAHLDAAVPDTRLHLVLVEKLVSYSGQNGIRFHPMVARGRQSVSNPGLVTEHEFDLAQVTAALKEHIAHWERENEFRFVERKDDLAADNLAVVAYLESNTEVLQASYVEWAP